MTFGIWDSTSPPTSTRWCTRWRDLSDPVRGWGRRDETWNFMAALRGLAGRSWFQLGDARSRHARRAQLAAGAGRHAERGHGALVPALGIAARVLPMSDDPVRTRVLTDEGWLDFQDYFVHRQCRPAVRAFHVRRRRDAHARSPRRWRRSSAGICAPSSSAPRILSSASSRSSRCRAFALRYNSRMRRWLP